MADQHSADLLREQVRKHYAAAAAAATGTASCCEGCGCGPVDVAEPALAAALYTETERQQFPADGIPASVGSPRSRMNSALRPREQPNSFRKRSDRGPAIPFFRVLNPHLVSDRRSEGKCRGHHFEIGSWKTLEHPNPHPSTEWGELQTAFMFDISDITIRTSMKALRTQLS